MRHVSLTTRDELVTAIADRYAWSSRLGKGRILDEFKAHVRSFHSVFAHMSIVFGPGGGTGQGIIEGMPKWRNPMPWKNTPLTPNIGKEDSTDDMRPGLGLAGVEDVVRRREGLRQVHVGGQRSSARGSAQAARQVS